MTVILVTCSFFAASAKVFSLSQRLRQMRTVWSTKIKPDQTRSNQIKPDQTGRMIMFLSINAIYPREPRAMNDPLVASRSSSWLQHKKHAFYISNRWLWFSFLYLQEHGYFEKSQSQIGKSHLGFHSSSTRPNLKMFEAPKVLNRVPVESQLNTSIETGNP